jgi:HD-GYP domain-containing protein (c-di-GMP phosphodiesterase class II)
MAAQRVPSRVVAASGGLPIPEPSLRLGELVTTFALGQDNAFGQPLESQLRSCLLADAMCREIDAATELRETVYWLSLLRYIGCTGHAHEISTVFGDDVAILAATLVFDAGDPSDVGRTMVAYATAGHPPEEHEAIAKTIQESGHDWAVHNFATGCEVGGMLIDRLGLGADVQEAFAFTYERWNGAGFPTGATGEEIPLATRIVHVSHDMEAIGRRFSPEEAIDAARDRRGRTYDPELADLFVAHGDEWFRQLAKLEPWDAVLDLEPEPHRTLAGAELDEALTVAADFIDLKSPYRAGHSRRCAELAGGAGEALGCADDEVTAIRRAALVHEFGTTGVPNSIWDKPGPLTRAELDRVEVHPMLTEQMLRRSQALALLNPLAGAHHERADGSGYHKGLRATERGAEILAAVDVYVGLTTDRADRDASSAGTAAVELRRLVSAGLLEPGAVEAVLTAAGHDEQPSKRRRIEHPGGLSDREVEVLRLAARGLTTRGIAEQLYISPKTADHHIQHVYAKIGVATRAAAALWAMQHELVR